MEIVAGKGLHCFPYKKSYSGDYSMNWPYCHHCTHAEVLPTVILTWSSGQDLWLLVSIKAYFYFFKYAKDWDFLFSSSWTWTLYILLGDCTFLGHDLGSRAAKNETQWPSANIAPRNTFLCIIQDSTPTDKSVGLGPHYCCPAKFVYIFYNSVLCSFSLFSLCVCTSRMVLMSQ